MDSVVECIRNILETAGIEVDIALATNSLPKLTNNGLSRDDCMSLLQNYRDPTMRDRVHVIIGGWSGPSFGNFAGRTIQQWGGSSGPAGSWGVGHYKCRRLANSGEVQNCREALDRVGCFVFSDAIIDLIDNNIGAASRWHGYEGAIAIIAAHEIGHAMGIVMEFPPTPNVEPSSLMFGITADSLFGDPLFTYDKFDQFIGGDTNYGIWNCNTFPDQKSSVNLRDLLGVSTVDIGS